jgi:3-hydroxyisobutyrate dehydrogenase
MSKTIGFVGVGRMGANMARRLECQGFPIAAVCDVNREAARALASELGTVALENLSAVSASADVIFTVVTDDAAQLSLFSESGDSLLVGARGKTFINPENRF